MADGMSRAPGSIARSRISDSNDVGASLAQQRALHNGQRVQHSGYNPSSDHGHNDSAQRLSFPSKVRTIQVPERSQGPFPALNFPTLGPAGSMKRYAAQRITLSEMCKFLLPSALN
jgi:hypothetical protein